jgi:hypothetical protein
MQESTGLDLGVVAHSIAAQILIALRETAAKVDFREICVLRACYYHPAGDVVAAACAVGVGRAVCGWANGSCCGAWSARGAGCELG